MMKRWLSSGLTWLALAGTAGAQIPTPQLQAVFPPGAKAGTTVDVTITGADLDDASKLLASHPGITAEPKVAAPSEFQSPRPLPNQFVVKIAADVPPGVYDLRAVGYYGISNPRRFVVGTAAEVQEKEPNNDPAQANELPLEATASGTADADGFDFFKLPLKQGARVIIRCQARSLDARLEPTLTLLDAAGAEVARGRANHRGDAVVDFTPPADGAYVLKLHDIVYRGGAEFGYRLTASTGPHVDFVFPPSGQPGAKGKFTLYGRNLPGGTKSPLSLDGRPLDMLAVEIEIPGDAAARTKLPATRSVGPVESGQDAFEYRLSGSPTGPGATIFFASAPVVVEQEPPLLAGAASPAGASLPPPQTVTTPCEIVGQFYPRGDLDVYQFTAKKDETLWIELLSQRLGANTDPYVMLQRVAQDGQGKEQTSLIAELDDDAANLAGQNDRSFRTRNDDVTYKFQVPADGTYRLIVRDVNYRSKGSPQMIYRLAIRTPQPDFRLVAVPLGDGPSGDEGNVRLAGPVLRKGGASAIRVVAFRRDGFDGEIALRVDGLPAGVTAPPAVIGAGSTSGMVTLVAGANATDGVHALTIAGESQLAGAAVTREARSGEVIWSAQNNNEAPRSRLTTAIPLTVVTSHTAAALVQPAEAKVHELSRGGKLEIPLSIVRQGDFKGALNLQTRNAPPNVNINNPNVDAAATTAKVTVNVSTNATPGTYSFYLHAQTQWNNYRRNPKAAELAEKDKQEIDKLAADIVKATQQAQQAKQTAEQAANSMANLAKQAETAVAAAEKESQTTQQTVTAAATKLATAKSAAEKKADDAALKKALESAQQEHAAAEQKAKAAADKLAAAKTAQQAAQGNAKTAAAAKAAADKAMQEAQAKQQRVEQVKQQVNQQAQAAKNRSNPQQLNNVIVVSTPIVLKIAPAPITVTLPSPTITLKQGDKAELPVTIARLFGYNDPVELQLSTQGVSGLQAPQASIAAAQTTGKLMLQAAANTPVGEHKLSLEARSRPNGQNVPVKIDVVVKIEAGEKKK